MKKVYLVCFMIFTFSLAFSQEQRAIVISGGGARGAWGVGVAKGLSIHENKQYSIGAGTSTGSLMGPLVLLRDFDRLEQAYTSVTQKDIFNVNPFKKNGDINFFKFGWRIMWGKKTLGESKPLLTLIKKFMTEDDFNRMRDKKLAFGAANSSVTKNIASVKSSDEYAYNDMVEWMWGSANEPIFMTTLEKEGQAWVDGGVKDYLPIQWVIDKGYKEIDVIIHKSLELIDTTYVQEGGVLNLLLRTLTILETNVAEFDIQIAKLEAMLEKGVTLNFYYMSPDQISKTKNSLIFDKKIMTEILNEGYQSVVDGTIIKKTFSIDNAGKLVVSNY